MTQNALFPQQLTVLRVGSWLGRDSREERLLPLEPSDYQITPREGDARWTVTVTATGAVAYNGIGPVEIFKAEKLTE
ncbi:hypothetical protein ACSFA0_22835 [Variovorax sp. LT1P1]|uniref:hypothetical protein n=1 Tax=Variovorax sp. LT1P1 TaxID=3443730 RepID=UPI003F445A78